MPRSCLTWRHVGGFWSLHEDGEGERLHIENSIRDVRLDDLSDEDLIIIRDLLNEAIEARRISKPARK